MKTKEKRKLTPAQKEAVKQKREWLKSLTKQAEAHGDPDWPVVTVEGHALSPTNCVLAIMQCPVAKTVGGFRQWKKHGRQVMKGQKGIAIWFPCKTRQEDGDEGEGDGETQSRAFFRVGTVFDISQTEPLTERPDKEPKEAGASKADLLAALTF